MTLTQLWKQIESVMNQHYGITRNLKDLDQEQDNGSDGTSKDGEVTLAGMEMEMNTGNKLCEPQGNHKDQQNTNQVQFHNPVQVPNSVWGSAIIEAMVGRQNNPHAPNTNCASSILWLFVSPGISCATSLCLGGGGGGGGGGLFS